MKFEKINKNKMKVTLNINDLNVNDIDFHSFMANSEESHSLFLNVLDKAEKDYGFTTKNYNLKIETLALVNGEFILTITRELDAMKDSTVISPRKKLHVYRKENILTDSIVIYKFSTFDNFCYFTKFIHNSNFININNIAKNSVLYNCNGNYFLVLLDINYKSTDIKKLASAITEFATYIDSSDIFLAKLHERASIVFKNKAIQTCIKYFVQK